MPMRIFLASLAMALLTIGACSSPPDSTDLQALTEGLWHGVLDGDDYLLELTYDGGTFGGQFHRLAGERQITGISVADVSLDGTAIEIKLAGFPPYQGQTDLSGGRIDGGIPMVPAYADFNLRKVDRTDWPMASARPAAAPGEPAYIWTRPAEREDGWVTGAPADVGIDSNAVEQAVTAILAGEAGNMHSLLLVREGTLVVEEYFHGWGVDDLHGLASCTKSVSSLLVGIAIDHGYLDGVDLPLLDFFSERASSAGTGWEKIRLEHLLTMSMGLDWTDQEAEQFAPPGGDRLTDVLARNVEQEPGTHWRYVSRDTHLLSNVILEATGKHADVFAAEYLFAPLEISTWDWETNKYEDHPSMSGTLEMHPRDMAKVGQLVLGEGSWKGQPVVSPEWVRESARVHMFPPGSDGYGYLWWLFDEPAPGGVVYANGIGSQFIAVVPALDLVVVTTGGNEFNAKHMAILEVLERSLMPGVGPTR